MFASLTAARSELEGIALEFDASSFAGCEALRVVDELGAIRRVVDAMLAKTAKRVADANAHAVNGDRDAATAVARSLGVGAGEVRDAMKPQPSWRTWRRRTRRCARASFRGWKRE